MAAKGTVYDVIVIGGGPAGSGTALSLVRRGRRVALFDAGRFEGFRGGETLPPETNPLLRSLGITRQFASLQRVECPGTVSAWGSTAVAETDFIRNPYGCGWHVDRCQFDRMLLDYAAACGVHVTSPSVVTACRRASATEWKIDSKTSAGHLQTRCSAVVDASGSNGFRAAGPYRREQNDALVALVFEFSSARELRDARTGVESAPRGWWYTAPTARGTLSVMFFTDRQTYAEEGIEIGAQLAPCALTTRRVDGCRLLTQRIVQARSALNREPALDGWIAVGDSASCFDPVAGGGVWKALRDAEAAAAAVHEWLNGSAAKQNAYAASIRAEFETYSRRRAACYLAEQRWPRERFWCRWQNKSTSGRSSFFHVP